MRTRVMQGPESKMQAYLEIDKDLKWTSIQLKTSRITDQIILSFLKKVWYLCVVKVFDTRNNESNLLWFNRCHDTILQNKNQNG